MHPVEQLAALQQVRSQLATAKEALAELDKLKRSPFERELVRAVRALHNAADLAIVAAARQNFEG